MMKRLNRVQSLVAVALFLTVLLVPVTWASGDADLPQQAGSGRDAAALGPEGLVSVSGSVDVRVGKSSDDAEEYKQAPYVGKVQDGSTKLELGSGPAGLQYVGLRFDNLGIPKGVTITQAYIEFTAVMPDRRELEAKIAGYQALWDRTDEAVPVLWFTTSRNKANRLREAAEKCDYRDCFLIGLLEDARGFLTRQMWRWSEAPGEMVQWIKPPAGTAHPR